MIVFLAAFLAIALYKIRFAKKGEIFDDCLSLEKTNSIRGVFIILVFFSHFTSYIQINNILDQYEQTLMSLIGQRMVTMFLLYSGYGIMESIKKKGTEYVQNIPFKRIGKVLFQFDIAVLIYILVRCIIGKASLLTIKNVLLSLIGWKSVGNSNWYIFAILVAYLAVFIGFKIAKNRYASICITTGLILCYCISMHFFTSQGLYWYDTILCFPLGMVISAFREKLYYFFMSIPVWLSAVAVILVIQAISYKFSWIVPLRITAMITFSLLVLLITMRISVDNPVLRYLGSHLFGLYIMQRIPMILLQHFGLFHVNTYLCLGISIVSTLILAIVFDWSTDKCFKLITTNKRKAQS